MLGRDESGPSWLASHSSVSGMLAFVRDADSRRGSLEFPKKQVLPLNKQLPRNHRLEGLPVVCPPSARSAGFDLVHWDNRTASSVGVWESLGHIKLQTWLALYFQVNGGTSTCERRSGAEAPSSSCPLGINVCWRAFLLECKHPGQIFQLLKDLNL